MLIAFFTVAALLAIDPAQPGSPTKTGDPVAGAPAAQTILPTLVPLAHVEVRGNGPVPVILVPGLACDWTVYEGFMARNSEKYTMYAVTLPGFGESQPPPLPEGAKPSNALWLENAERALLDLIQSKNIDKPVLVGHSLGGHLAFRMAAAHPDKFRGFVALDGAPAFPMAGDDMTKDDRAKTYDGAMGQRIMATDDAAWQLGTKNSAKGMIKDPQRAAKVGEMCAKVKAQTAMRYMVELMAADVRDGLKDCKTPILMLPAISDMTPDAATRQYVRDMWKRIFKDLPNVTVVFFENCRHFITEDAPQELDNAIAAFVAGKEVRGRPEQAAEAKPAAPAAAPSEAAPSEPKK